MKVSTPELLQFFALALNYVAVALVIPGYTDHVIGIGGSLESAAIGAAIRSVVGFFATPVLGSLSDTMGRKIVCVICFIGTFVGMIVAGTSNSIFSFQVSRVLLGLFWNANPILGAFIIDSTPKEQLESQMGTMAAACGMGYIFGVASGGFIASTFGNHVPSILAGVFNLIALFVILRVPESKVDKSNEKSKKTLKETFGGVFEFWGRPNLKNPLTSRLLQESSLAIINGTILEFARIAFAMSPSSRGFLFMWLGIVNTLLQGNMDKIVKTCFKNSEDALRKSLIATGVGSLVLPFSSDQFAFVALSTLVSASQAFLYPLSNSLLSRSVDSKEQGSLLGASESFVSLGGIVAPLITGYLLPVSIQLPFIVGSLATFVASSIFPSDISKQKKK
eukprot:TRINITY_DN2427_c1_g1_i1.p1 TRINITY_DN2427_c1_g1~~TRINITY_DN2427_c1_g1_i1.p1  ORF type:complete len:392 (+),score=96.47 TRINITY_DN2427_c1_g1_i1:75-1250(+)